MHSLLLSLLATSPSSEASDHALSAAAEATIPIFTTAIVFTMTTAIVAISLYAAYRSSRLKLETIRFAIEKGVPVPEALLGNRRPPVDLPTRDLRRGLVLVGLGTGLGLFLRILDGTSASGVWSVGFVPMLLGAGYLVTWFIARRGSAASIVRE
jgi:hypothetical protein